MIKFIKILIILTLYGITISCEDSVNTNAEFRERYVLTSIVDCESDKQIAYVTKTYDNTLVGRNPEMESLFVHGADVKMWYKYDVYDLIDTTLIDSLGNNVSGYVINGLNPDGDQYIEIEALLPNNILLSSITQIPSVSKLRIEESNLGEISNNSIKSAIVNWTNMGNYIYDPQLIIKYYFHGDTNYAIKEKVVPLDIIIDNSETVYVYPKPSNQSVLNIEKEILNVTMDDISKDDPVKSNYVIVNAELQLRIYDEHLTAYYSSTHQFLDQFSVSLDTQIYSNIDSGLGIFASYITKYLVIGIDKEYIRSFGYRYVR